MSYKKEMMINAIERLEFLAVLEEITLSKSDRKTKVLYEIDYWYILLKSKLCKYFSLPFSG